MQKSAGLGLSGPGALSAADLSHLERNCKVKGYVMEVGQKPIDHMAECLAGCSSPIVTSSLAVLPR